MVMSAFLLYSLETLASLKLSLFYAYKKIDTHVRKKNYLSKRTNR